MDDKLKPHLHLEQATAATCKVIVGKRDQVRLALACLLARGHLLIEDLPGMGKTTLAHTLAHVLQLRFNRVQFTSDLLPADILGVSVYERQAGGFQFHPGPIFTQVVMADEINRATPKTQSALLEAMEERQVTIEGETRPLPEPFFVIATQNPIQQAGTFPLPESQLDRFLMRIRLGYPDREAERALLSGRERRTLLHDIEPAMSTDQLVTLQQLVARARASEPLLDYIQLLLDESRNAPGLERGLSPRGGLALLAAARAWAVMSARDYVLPEDVQAVFPSVAGHRLQGRGEWAAEPGAALAARLVETVPVP